jgi:vacuolar-type H+-ATPase subunit C/Vma6
MSLAWEDLVARVHGLSARLLSPALLRDLAHAEGLEALAGALAEAGYGARPEEATPQSLEEMLRRAAAARQRNLAWWSGKRVPARAPVFE